MDELIRPVMLKLERAAKQRDALIAFASEWAKNNPSQTHVEFLPNRHGYKVVLDPFKEALPFDDLGLTLGEFAHNLRSALDNLAFALARLQAEPPLRPKDLAFPIFDDPTAFAKVGKRYLQQLPEEAARLIQMIQPFNRDLPGAEKLSEKDPLILLQRVNNSDKHRIPAVALFAPETFELSATVIFADELAADLNTPPDVTIWAGPLAPGVPLLEYRTRHPLEKAGGNIKVQAVVSVICDEKKYPLFELITSLHDYVCLVVGQFSHFFKPQ